MTTTKEQIQQALETLRLVADTIRQLKKVPSGVLYAQLMGVMELSAYEKIIGTLTRTGLIKESCHQLEWIGPTISEEKNQNSLV